MPVFLDLNPFKLLVLGVIALLIFGPERLPAMAAQAGRLLRQLRNMAEGAKSELQENLGPEFSNFDIADLNPKRFVRKHLVDELTGDGALLGGFGDTAVNGTGANGSYGADVSPLTGRPSSMATLTPGESPPYDAEAT
jgi:sec-independent protein translocase protein TatB